MASQLESDVSPLGNERNPVHRIRSCGLLHISLRCLMDKDLSEKSPPAAAKQDKPRASYIRHTKLYPHHHPQDPSSAATSAASHQEKHPAFTARGSWKALVHCLSQMQPPCSCLGPCRKSRCAPACSTFGAATAVAAMRSKDHCSASGPAAQVVK